MFCGYQQLSQPNQLEHEVHQSPPRSAEVKNGCSYSSTPPICLCGVVTDSFTPLITFAQKTENINYTELAFREVIAVYSENHAKNCV